MKASEIKKLSVDELKSQIADNQGLVERLKFAHAISPIENPLKIRNTKRLVAKLKTELSTR